MKKRIIRTAVILLTLVLTFTMVLAEPAEVVASSSSTNYVYTTTSLGLKKSTTGKTVYKVKKNAKLVRIKMGKKWTTVKYKGKTLVVPTKYVSREKAPLKYYPSQFRSKGVVYWHAKKYTWYSQRVLPGGGLNIPGRHLDSRGYVCDKDGYIVLASTSINKGRIIATPFGRYGKVYDTGVPSSNWFDVYVGW